MYFSGEYSTTLRTSPSSHPAAYKTKSDHEGSGGTWHVSMETYFFKHTMIHQRGVVWTEMFSQLVAVAQVTVRGVASGYNYRLLQLSHAKWHKHGTTQNI